MAGWKHHENKDESQQILNSFIKHDKICNNNKSSYYKDPISSTIFIRKDYFDEYMKSNKIKYFCFTERYLEETGYSNETSMHFEIENNIIHKEIPNYIHENYGINERDSCEKCPYGLLEERQNNSSLLSEYLKIIKKYDIEDE